MINKQFDLNSFKAQASKMSDFLNGKGHKIPKSTLYHGLSVMMGEANWNTLHAKLNPKSVKKETQENKPSFSDMITFAGQTFSKANTFNIIRDFFSDVYINSSFSIDEALDNLISNALSRTMRDNIAISNITEDALSDPKELASNFYISDGHYFSNITHQKYEEISAFIDGRIASRLLIGNEFVFSVEYQFDFNQNAYDNASKIFYSALLAEIFSERNELYPSIFVLAPIIRINSRGTRVKISIFSFIDKDIYNALGKYDSFHYYDSEDYPSHPLIFKKDRFSQQGKSILRENENMLDQNLGSLSIGVVSLNSPEALKLILDKF